MTNVVTTMKVDPASGEITTGFDLPRYALALSESLATQQALARAYDQAVAALIGPNDKQVEGARTFLKKSAFRKLARHFTISTEVVHREREYLEMPDGAPVFVASVTVRATAPWGQYVEAVGACATDEEIGDRAITIADAIATAETRATNRAISNLVAMGEPSAEEIGERTPVRERGPEPRCPVCGGRMWDNRDRKRNPNAPDFKCRDKNCEGVYWPGEWPPPKPEPSSGESASAATVSGAAPAVENTGSPAVADEDRKLRGRPLGEYTVEELQQVIEAASTEPERYADLIATVTRVMERKIAFEEERARDAGADVDDAAYAPDDDSY